MAALYAANAVEVTPFGIVRGHDAVQKRLEADMAAGGRDFSIAGTSAQVSGNTGWRTGDWSGYYGSQQVRGYWSAVDVREGDTWKIQMLTIVVAMPPPGQGAGTSK